MLRSTEKRSFSMPPDEFAAVGLLGTAKARWAMSAVTRGQNGAVGRMIAEDAAGEAEGTDEADSGGHSPLSRASSKREADRGKPRHERMMEDVEQLTAMLQNMTRGLRRGGFGKAGDDESDEGADLDRRGTMLPRGKSGPALRPGARGQARSLATARSEGFSKHVLELLKQYKRPEKLKALKARVREIQGDRAFAHDIMRRNIETQGRLTPAACAERHGAWQTHRAQQAARNYRHRKRFAKGIARRKADASRAGDATSAARAHNPYSEAPCSDYIAAAFVRPAVSPKQADGTPAVSPALSCAPDPRPASGDRGASHERRVHGQPRGPRPPPLFWSVAPRYSEAAEERRKALKEGFHEQRARAATARTPQPPAHPSPAGTPVHAPRPPSAPAGRARLSRQARTPRP